MKNWNYQMIFGYQVFDYTRKEYKLSIISQEKKYIDIQLQQTIFN
jgi:hypothetical protein